MKTICVICTSNLICSTCETVQVAADRFHIDLVQGGVNGPSHNARVNTMAQICLLKQQHQDRSCVGTYFFCVLPGTRHIQRRNSSSTRSTGRTVRGAFKIMLVAVDLYQRDSLWSCGLAYNFLIIRRVIHGDRSWTCRLPHFRN